MYCIQAFGKSVLCFEKWNECCVISAKLIVNVMVLNRVQNKTCKITYPPTNHQWKWCFTFYLNAFLEFFSSAYYTHFYHTNFASFFQTLHTNPRFAHTKGKMPPSASCIQHISNICHNMNSCSILVCYIENCVLCVAKSVLWNWKLRISVRFQTSKDFVRMQLKKTNFTKATKSHYCKTCILYFR